jgi:MATE family multidrug resistance protein
MGLPRPAGAAALRHEARETLRLALPIAFAQIALTAMGLVDAAFVGRVSNTELAAVSIGNQLVFAAMCPAMGVTLAVEPLAAQAVGAGDRGRAWRSVRAAVVAVLALSVPTMIVAWAISLPLERGGIPPAVARATQGYVLARLPGIPTYLAFLAAKAYLEALGFTRPVLVVGVLANVVNFAANGLLVFGDRSLRWLGLPAIGLPELGSAGAGLATSASCMLLAALTIFAAFSARPRGATFLRGALEQVRANARTLVRVGLPIGGTLLTEVGIFTLITILAGRFGATAAAAHQIALGLGQTTFMACIGMSSATSVRVAHAIGARRVDATRRAGLVGLGLGTVIMACGGVVFMAAPRALAALFSNDEAVLDVAETLVRIAAVFAIADGVQAVGSGALRGAADTRFAWFAYVVCQWGVAVPLALLLAFRLGYGASGLWWGLTVGLYCVATMILVRFLRLSSRPIAALR